MAVVALLKDELTPSVQKNLTHRPTYPRPLGEEHRAAMRLEPCGRPVPRLFANSDRR
jgi:hypothetical protein